MTYNQGIGTPYWYEWEIGLLKCLDMMMDDQIESIVFQSPNYQSLDDVVINYKDGKSSNIQVKHTDVNDNFSYSFLSNGSNSLIKEWMKEWNEKENKNRIKEIHIITNKRWGVNETKGRCPFSEFINSVFPLLQKNYSYSGEKESHKKAISWFKAQLGTDTQTAEAFVKILHFDQADNLSGVRSNIHDKLKIILGTDNKVVITNAYKSLISNLETWVTSLRETKISVNKEDIYHALCIDSSNDPIYEVNPEKPILPSRERFAEEFINTIKKTNNKIIWLQGMPGSGKTNFVSFLAQRKNSIVDFRFYTYIPVNRDFPSFSDDEGYYSGEYLWKSILHQIKIGLEEKHMLCTVGFPLVYDYLSVTEKRALALKYLPIYADILGRTCFFFIDGLDHAARSKDKRNTFLLQLPEPEEISNKVKIVLVGQPDSDNYPLWLKNNDQIDYIELPELACEDVMMLLEDEKAVFQDINLKTLSDTIISVIGNNALNVLFAIQEMKRSNLLELYKSDAIKDFLLERKLNSQIRKYYEWIFESASVSPYLKKIEFIFAFASQKISLENVALLCSIDEYLAVTELEKLHPLIRKDDEMYYVFHNDVRLYFRECLLKMNSFSILRREILNRIINDDRLERYSYDISFNSLCVAKDITSAMNLFSYRYIIKSIKYSIPLDRIMRQFVLLTEITGANALQCLHGLSLAATTLYQFTSCVQYYGKAEDYYENKILYGKTESEKYLLDSNTDLSCIVNDIYQLLKNEQINRAGKIFKEYLKSTTLNDYLSIEIHSDTYEKPNYYEKCGYICRYFNNSIFEDTVDESSTLYDQFVEGWLLASSRFLKPEQIKRTFTFKYYYLLSLKHFFEDICRHETITNDTYAQLNKIALQEKNICIIINLCYTEILNGYDSEDMIDYVLHHYPELINEEKSEIWGEQISCLIKALFCIYPKINGISQVKRIYLDILRGYHISMTSRGYKPAIAQFEMAQIIIEFFYYINHSNDELQEVLCSLAFVDNLYGAGSCNDCYAYQVREILYSINLEGCKKNDSKETVLDLCQKCEWIFTSQKPRYYDKLARLYILADAKNEYIRIADYWSGSNGVLWDNEFDEIESRFTSIASILDHFGEQERIKTLSLQKRYRIVSYSGHKDYSMNDLLNWYKHLPSDSEKLILYGMRLLSISDHASNMGDNRFAGLVEKELFNTAIHLGPQYLDALFELKNTPEDFIEWRDYILTVYSELLDGLDLPDTDLFCLYQLFQAWINPSIENNKTRGKNRVTTLHRFNKMISEKISNPTLKALIIPVGSLDADYSDSEVQLSEEESKLVLAIQSNGYTDAIREQIVDYFLHDKSTNKLQLLLSLRKYISPEKMKDYVRECIVGTCFRDERIYKEHYYFSEYLEEFHIFFSEQDWQEIITKELGYIHNSIEEDLFILASHLECLDLYYSLFKDKESIKARFTEKLDMHWSFITACGLLYAKSYELTMDPSIHSLTDFMKKQIG